MSNFYTKAVIVDRLNQNELIVKSNNLIEASYKLTTQEQKIILLVASMIQPDDVDFKEYYIDVQLFMQLIGVIGNSKYEELKAITKKLKERVLIIKDLVEDTETQVNWVSSFTYYNKQGYVQIRFDPALKPYFLNLKNRFTQYQRKYVLSLKSFYSIRLYELLKQYEKIGERYFAIEELKKILGISPEQYELYGDFKRKILKRAEKELPEKTDICFKFKERKLSRKVIGIYFFIESNQLSHNNQDDIEIESLNIELYTRLQSYFCLSQNQARQALQMKPENELLENLAYVEQKLKSNNIQNIGSYTWKVIQEDIRLQSSLFENEKQQQTKDKNLIQELESLYKTERKNKVNSIIANFSESERKTAENAFSEYVKTRSDFVKQRYKATGLDGVKVEYLIFIGEKYLSELDNDFILWAKKNHNQTIQKNAQNEYELT